jgi:hypothetical protein
MNRQLLEDVHRYFSGKENPTQEEKDLLMRLGGELPYFQITTVHRDDLEQAGLDGSHVTDAQMETIADKMADAYIDEVFWIDLKIIAEDCANVPLKPENMKKGRLISEIKQMIAEYGAFNTAETEADASPCIHNSGGVTILAEFFCADCITATTYNDKGVDIHSEFMPYTDLDEDVLRSIYKLCAKWKIMND